MLPRVEAAVGSLGGGDEAGRHGVPGDHADQCFHLGLVADEFGAGEAVASADAQADGLAVVEVQLPLTRAGCQQGLAVLHLAQRLAVDPPGPAAHDVREHQPLSGRGGHREAEHRAHGHVGRAHHTCLDAPAQWPIGLVRHLGSP